MTTLQNNEANISISGYHRIQSPLKTRYYNSTQRSYVPKHLMKFFLFTEKSHNDWHIQRGGSGGAEEEPARQGTEPLSYSSK